MNDPQLYIARLKKLNLEQKQHELRHCVEKMRAAMNLADYDLVKYYVEPMNYLILFEITEERLDVVKRRKADFQKNPLE